jgi:hypothetical protein
MRRLCVALLVGVVVVLVWAWGGSSRGWQSAGCQHPLVTYRKPSVAGDHRGVVVHFTCAGARQAGTIYLPLRRGRHPAVVWVHGAGEAARLTYGPLGGVCPAGDRVLQL